jgi:hypothetical protein
MEVGEWRGKPNRWSLASSASLSRKWLQFLMFFFPPFFRGNPSISSPLGVFTQVITRARSHLPLTVRPVSYLTKSVLQARPVALARFGIGIPLSCRFDLASVTAWQTCVYRGI